MKSLGPLRVSAGELNRVFLLNARWWGCVRGSDDARAGSGGTLPRRKAECNGQDLPRAQETR